MSFTREEILQEFVEAAELGRRLAPEGFSVTYPDNRRDREAKRMRAYRAANRVRLNAAARVRDAGRAAERRSAERSEYMRAYCKRWRAEKKERKAA